MPTERGDYMSIEFIQFLSNFGLSAVLCGAMMWYVYHRESKNDEKIEKMEERHADEVAGLQCALENNTKAITELAAYLKTKETL